MRASLTLAVLAAFCCFSAAEASIKIDFESGPTGAVGGGSVVYNQGGFTVKVSNHEGSIVNTDASLGLDNYYLSSVDPTNANGNDYSVSLNFSKPISGTVSFDAAYLDQNGLDFRVIDQVSGDTVFSAFDGADPNPKAISFDLPQPTTSLIFRDNNVKTIAIDNLVVQPVPEVGSILVWSAVGCGIFGMVLRRRKNHVG
ncbi:hypothetical protein NG895_27930 [Aeoliella sp. ICT_H6.2]|uniref:PEP-CTERM protein-sorting domain-containing protein n=1 Tax=Aeoliella straminimaris TaxID=2954799 RepID=A0A9X2FJ26_9BACT|nr:hypothetical protein [Aeoliella straminimaris]MCO6047751.1 hypothetical protein [Aeoliella straminimaris]